MMVETAKNMFRTSPVRGAMFIAPAGAACFQPHRGGLELSPQDYLGDALHAAPSGLGTGAIEHKFFLHRQHPVGAKKAFISASACSVPIRSLAPASIASTESEIESPSLSPLRSGSSMLRV